MVDEATASAWIKPRRKRQTVLLLGVLREALLRLAPQLRSETVELLDAADPGLRLPSAGGGGSI